MEIKNSLKRFVLSSVLIIVISGVGSARDITRGYRGFFDVIGEALFEHKNTYYHHKEIVFSIIGLTTTHGYQLNKNLFVGCGMGLEAQIINTEIDAIIIGMPLFLMGRFDRTIGKVPLYVDLKIGTMIGSCSDKFMLNPTIGYRADWGRKISLNIGIGASLHYFGDYKVGNPGKVKILPGVRLGFEF